MKNAQTVELNPDSEEAKRAEKMFRDVFNVLKKYKASPEEAISIYTSGIIVLLNCFFNDAEEKLDAFNFIKDTIKQRIFTLEAEEMTKEFSECCNQ